MVQGGKCNEVEEYRTDEQGMSNVEGSLKYEI